MSLPNFRTTGEAVNTRLTALETAKTSAESRLTTIESTTIPNVDSRVTTLANTTVPSIANRVSTVEQNALTKNVADGYYLGKEATSKKTFALPFVVPNETTQVATLTATVDGITELYNGLTIAFRCPFTTLASSTLNLNGLGDKPIYYQATTTSSGRVPANGVVILVYETITKDTGCWKIVWSYQADNTARQYQTTTNVNYPILTRYDTTDKGTSYVTTYARYAMAVTLNPSRGSITVPGGILESDGTTHSYIKLSGSRGTIAGNETVASLSGSQTITATSADTTVITTDGATTLTFTAAAETVCAVKVIALSANTATTVTYEGAVWANGGSAPTWGTAGKKMVLVANFILGLVILSVAHNGESV